MVRAFGLYFVVYFSGLTFQVKHWGCLVCWYVFDLEFGCCWLLGLTCCGNSGLCFVVFGVIVVFFLRCWLVVRSFGFGCLNSGFLRFVSLVFGVFGLVVSVTVCLGGFWGFEVCLFTYL